ncbi:hypothetical protein ACHMZP_26040 [Rhodococcus baikonurensis]|uniref:hypothetical protein n=1 Tax=Rhodococcus baikonurensis TaxID=172041 RepID=UPI00379A2C83
MTDAVPDISVQAAVMVEPPARHKDGVLPTSPQRRYRRAWITCGDCDAQKAQRE